MPLPQVIDYAPVPPKRDAFRRRHPVLWAVVRLNLWAFAMLGPLFVVFGIRSFFIPPDGSLVMFGHPVETNAQRAIWIIANCVIGTLGIWFVLYHTRSWHRTP